jgi:hypothetical protein
VLEELGERYLGPAGVDLDEAVREIFDTTELGKQYRAKKRSLRREWHIVASDGVNANDIKKAADRIPAVREARSSGVARRVTPSWLSGARPFTTTTTRQEKALPRAQSAAYSPSGTDYQRTK